MTAVIIGIWVALAALTWAVHARKGRPGVEAGAGFAWRTAKSLSVRLPFALLTAAFLAEALPVERLASVVGPETGLLGIVVSAGLGGLLPGGPMTSFPIALVIFQGGAGAPQIVAFITGWSIFAMHRVIAYEAPIMGWSFVALRMLSCSLLPILAGLLAWAVIALLPGFNPAPLPIPI
ncbi:MAG: hypothetical protein AAFR47_03355 [Pseudomonadota bacterium]